MGRRPGRLPGGQLPRAVVGVERHLPRHDARLLARRGARRRVRAAAHRLQRPLPGRRPPPVRVDQLHHRPRRLHAAPTSSPTTTSTTRPTRRATATGPTTTGPGTAASRATTDDPEIHALRDRQQRNFLATLLLSQGTPMLLGGDEFGRTQGGNNNGWCQDSRDLLVRLVAAGDQRRPARVHAQADRAAPRARRLPPPPVPVRARGGGLRACPDAAWFRADGERMRDEDWGGVAAGRRRVPQRRGDRLAGLARAPGARRVVPAAVQRATTRTARSRCRTARSARRGRSCCDTARPDVEPGDETLAAGDGVELVHHSLVLLRRDQPMTELRATYRLQLGGDFGFAAARALVPYLARARASRTSTCRRPSRRARARRTATTWSTRPRSRTSSAARRSSSRSCDAVQDAGLGIVLDIVPNHMATDAANRFWSDPELRAQFFDIDEQDGPPPALLRRRPPRGGAPGGPGGVRRDARSWRCGWCARGTSTGCGSTIRTGSPTPPATCSGCARAASSTSGWRRSSTPASRCATGRSTGTVGYEFLNDVCGLFVDPAGEAPLTDLWVEVRRRRPALRRAARSRPSSSRRGRRSRRRSSGCCARRPSAWPGWSARWRRSPSTAPTSSRGRGASRMRTAHAVAEAGLPASLASQAAARGAGLGGVRHALPADDAAGDGQGRRGHGVLPLRAAAGLERRRRRPGPVQRVGARLPPRQRASGLRASRATCSSPRRTTPSARATCGRGSARWRRCRTSSRRT